MTSAAGSSAPISIVTGGSGFIGRHLVRALRARGRRVRVVDTAPLPPSLCGDDGTEYAAVDICNAAALARAFEGADNVYHLAAVARVPHSIAHPLETNAVNIGGTAAVLEAARAAGACKLIFASSSSVYGGSTSPTGGAALTPLREGAELHPRSPYALQKLAGEMYCRLYAELYGLPTVCLRFFNVYGGDGAAASLVIPALLAQAAAGQPLTLTGDGTQARDFTHVTDVVEALLAAAASHVADGRAINVGTGVSTSMRQLAALIGGAGIEYVPPRRSEPWRTQADTARAREVLGWSARVALKEGIARLRAPPVPEAAQSLGLRV